MGSTEQKQNSQSESVVKRDPYKPTVAPLGNLIGQIDAQTANTGPTGNETGALDTLTQNAQAGNPFTGQMFDLANGLFAGGNGQVQGAYDDYKRQLSPYANGQNIGPDGNPAFKSYMDVVGNDVTNRVNGMFAAGGRDFSGANVNSLARGLTEGMAPIMAQQYNTDVGRQFDAANSLYGAGNSTAGLLGNMGQQGIGVGQQALQSRDSAANQMLSVEQQRRNLPVGNIGNLTGLLTPLAQLGGKTQGETSTTSSSTTTPPLGMQIVQGISALSGGGGGGGGWGGSGGGGAAAAKG